MKYSIFVLMFSFFLVGCHSHSEVERDRTDPIMIGVPASISVAAEDASGTPATESAITAFLNAPSASDLVDGSVIVTNDAPSVFPLGDTVVTFSASDSAGNKVSVRVIVTVVDLTAPILVLPENLTLMTSQDNGIEASRTEIETFLNAVTASDNVDINVGITNDAPTDFFPYGETQVEFTMNLKYSLKYSTLILKTGSHLLSRRR